MDESSKKRLIALGAEPLAEELLKLASRVEAAADTVERLLASPHGNLGRVGDKVSALRRARPFVTWRESASFARDLERVLDDIQASTGDPRQGVELCASFYETDAAVFENCDDSSGHVGDVYRYTARELFVSYAARCEDKAWLADRVLELNREDGYGIRDALIEAAAAYLPEENMRAMIRRLEQMAREAKDDYRRRHALDLVETLACQLKDAPLFERTRLASWGREPGPAACMDIARVYLESGDARGALAWLERLPEPGTLHTDDYDQLLFGVYAMLGDGEKQAEIAWRGFRRSRSGETLAKLLAVIGRSREAEVVASETAAILDAGELSLADALFLVEMGRLDEAETYLIRRADQLNGDRYGDLLALAEAMEGAGRLLAASLIYRALLDSILRHGQSNAYSHGVRYLHRLDALAAVTDAWHGYPDHAAYKERLRSQHGRKSSFWRQYRG